MATRNMFSTRWDCGLVWAVTALVAIALLAERAKAIHIPPVDPLVFGGNHSHQDHSGHDHSVNNLSGINLSFADLSNTLFVGGVLPPSGIDIPISRRQNLGRPILLVQVSRPKRKGTEVDGSDARNNRI